jgi:hypothetical protein
VLGRSSFFPCVYSFDGQVAIELIKQYTSKICSVGMMALKAGEMEEANKAVVAHSPVEAKVGPMNKSFAASGVQQ